jgi:small-conductance mechanosensitive channel/CRP-like cAMP-binding protein
MTETIDRLWSHLEPLATAQRGTSTVLVALLVLLLLRRFVDADARSRSRTPALFLVAALVFRAGAALAAGGSAAGVLGLLSVLCMVVGLVRMIGLVVFDVAFGRHPLPAVVRDLTQVVVVLAIFVGILYEHGFDPVSLMATGGVLTAVVGFALQSTIANAFAGIALPLERQLTIGDWIEVDGHVGRIREMKWRSTTILTGDGDTLVVPNNQLMTTKVTNFSRPTAAHRRWIRVGFHYRHPPNEVRAVLLDAVRGMPGVLVDPAPDCFPIEFGESAVTYALRVWADDFARLDAIVGEVRTRIWSAARRAGLEIPFPIHTVVTATPTTDDATARRTAALGRIDLFAPLDGECRNRLAGQLREQYYAEGEDIIRQDAPGDSLFIIDRGTVDVRVAVDGVHRSIAQLGPGQFFGEMSLMTGAHRQATCTALTDTMCWVIDRAAFRCVFDTRASIAEELSSILAERQVELDASRDGLSAEARARHTHETRSHLLRAIRDVFKI